MIQWEKKNEELKLMNNESRDYVVLNEVFYQISAESILKNF